MKGERGHGHCGRWLDSRGFTRRQMLQLSGAGFGSVALAGLLDSEAQAGQGILPGPHFAPKAKQVIWLFMGGGPSHIDTFDPKPALVKHHREEIPVKLPANLRDGSKKILASPFSWKRYGQSGLPVSELLPEMGKVADELCVVRSMHCDSIDHTGATLQTFTGMVSLPRPGIGCWLLHGLGSENDNLPGYIVMGPDQQSGTATYSSRFLPARNQGTKVEWDPKKLADARSAMPNLKNRGNLSVDQQRKQLDLLKRLNLWHLKDREQRDALNARADAFELAFRMQAAAPEAFEIHSESEATKSLYGLDRDGTKSFGTRCLLARRMVERGVRFVQIQCGKGDGLDWDQHGQLEKGHRKNAASTDRPVAGLIQDLKLRGLLDETLVIWGGEFGRTPTSQGENGREHHPHGYTLCMAGGGVKRGHIHGATDDFGWYAVEDKVHIHDFHATILHLMGIDHEKLTFRYSGRDFRLTDVHGQVVDGIIA